MCVLSNNVNIYILLFSTLILLNIRPKTSPNTPQRVCIAAQQSERDSCVLDSPKHRCLSEPHSSRIPPPRLNFPNIPALVSAPAPFNNNANPFAAPGQPAIYNGQTYNHLPPDLAAHIAACTCSMSALKFSESCSITSTYSASSTFPSSSADL